MSGPASGITGEAIAAGRSSPTAVVVSSSPGCPDSESSGGSARTSISGITGSGTGSATGSSPVLSGTAPAAASSSAATSPTSDSPSSAASAPGKSPSAPSASTAAASATGARAAARRSGIGAPVSWIRPDVTPASPLTSGSSPTTIRNGASSAAVPLPTAASSSATTRTGSWSRSSRASSGRCSPARDVMPKYGSPAKRPAGGTATKQTGLNR